MAAASLSKGSLPQRRVQRRARCWCCQRRHRLELRLHAATLQERKRVVFD